jgi:hypothetical protein
MVPPRSRKEPASTWIVAVLLHVPARFAVPPPEMLSGPELIQSVPVRLAVPPPETLSGPKLTQSVPVSWRMPPL